MTARPEPTLGAELLPCPFCGAETIDVFVQDGISWAACTECRAEGPPSDVGGDKAWNRRAALAAPAVVVSAEPVVFALRWAEDPRLNLSTMFDTELEAKEYAEKCLSSAEIVPLYTHLATPVGPDAVDARDAARYRFLRDGGIAELSFDDYSANPRVLEDSIVDAAMDRLGMGERTAALASARPSKGAA